jgi:hypothetical protein
MSQVAATVFNRQYLDAESGALAFLRDVGVPFDLAPDNIRLVEPDPWVRGVWRVHFATPWDSGGDGLVDAVVVFLAGYPESHGMSLREYNDFDW